MQIPTVSAKHFGRVPVLFVVVVIFPTLLAAIYFGLLANDVYVSESRIVVRAPDKPAQTAFGALLKTAGFTNASEEVYAITEYLESRDALKDANGKDLVRKAYGRESISIFDRFDPLGFDPSFEHLYRYFGNKLTVQNDTTTSVLTVSVRAYTPEDARAINVILLDHSERLINRLNDRGRQDLIGFAQKELLEAESTARQTAAQLAAFRNRTGVVDPEKQAQMQLELTSKLQDELIASRLQLQQVRQLAPDNPQIPLLEARVAQLERSITGELSKVTGNRTSLANNAARYEQLQIENEISGKRLTAAMTSLQEAQNEARRKQAYVERISQPNLPDEAIEPRRLAGILSVFAISLIVWGILSMLVASVREHAS